MMIINDLKYAIRLLFKKPGFTLLTTLVMAVGIGLSLFLFSLFNSMLFKALPFEDGDSMVRIAGSQNGVKGFGNSLNLHDYYEIRTNLKGITEFGAYYGESLNVSGRDGARRYDATFAEPNIFQLTRTKPVLGRVFTAAENSVGTENVVVIGYDMWQSQFAGDSGVIDQKLRINGETHRIIGVMPQGYFFPGTAELWLPLRQDATKSNRGTAKNVFGIAHLEDGTSSEDINRQLVVIMQRLEERYPQTNNGISAYADTFQMTAAADAIAVVYSVHIVAILILFLASINVGNLLLSRAVERGKETAIRVALGAPRSRLISQMLWESVIICTVGGLLGLIGLAWGLEVTEKVTATFSLGKLPFWWKFGVDSYTIKLFVTFVLVTIFFTGLLPAWKNSGADFNTVLRDGTRGSLGKKAGRLNRFLVASEIFLSITVMIAVGVIVIGTYLQTLADYGADTENTLTARVLLPDLNYDSPEKQIQFIRTLQSRLEKNSQVGNVMISSALPGAQTLTPSVALEGKEYTQDRGYPRANYIVVSPGSLSKLGVALKQGRYLNNSDDELDKSTIVVTETFASRHFPNDSAVGKRIRFVELDGEVANWLTIVGVVEHTIQGTAHADSGKIPSVFRPFAQAPRKQMTIALQMKSDTTTVTRTLRNTLQSVDPELPAFSIETYADNITRITAPSKFIGGILLLFGVAAVILAASGIYGVMSNTINQKTQEIGVKRALGANELRITKEFLFAGFKQLLWGSIPGLLLGCTMGFGMSKSMGIENAGMVIIAVTIVTIIAGVVMLATYMPTKRALEMEPSEALHYE